MPHSLGDALILESKVTNWNNLHPQFNQCLFVGHTNATRTVSAIQRDVWGRSRRTGWKQVGAGQPGQIYLIVKAAISKIDLSRFMYRNYGDSLPNVLPPRFRDKQTVTSFPPRNFHMP